MDSELPLRVTEFITAHLMPGERLVAVTHVHPMVMLVPGIIAAVGLLLGLVGLVAGEKGIGFAIIGIPIAVLAWIAFVALTVERRTTEFSCTDRRILIKSG